MQIEPTPAALERLAQLLPEKESLLKVAYDIEGCGCAVDGVVQLWKVSGRNPEDRNAYMGPVTLIYDHRQEVFFEDKLKMDYSEFDRCFSLKSDNQIYNTAMKIINKEGE